MKNKPAYICFYLETYTYIALKGNDLLVYNTIDGKYIKCFVDMSCIKVFSYFINSKCYSQCIKKADMSKQLWKVIYSIRNKFMGNYFSMNSVSEVLPFSFPFSMDFNLRKENYSLRSTLQTEVNLTAYINTIHIYPLSSKSKKGYISIYFYEYEEEIILKESTLNQLASLIKIQSVILQLPGIDALISQLITFYGEQVIKNRIIINTDYRRLHKINFLSTVGLWDLKNLNIFINLTSNFDEVYFRDIH